MPVLLIDRRRDGGAVIIRKGDVIQLNREAVSGLSYARPSQHDPPPKVKQARRDHDGQASLRRELRHNPVALHTMAAQLGLPAFAADELLQELFQSVGETPPLPVLRRARGGGEKPKGGAGANQLRCNGSQGFTPQKSAGNLSLLAPGAKAMQGNGSHSEKASTAPASSSEPPAPPDQRSAELRSEAVRDEALRSRLTAIRLRDLSRHHCPWVRDGYAWFIRQGQVNAQPGTR